ncbi:heme export protein [Cupriavidus sp. TA19]|uniref:heme ABC transporter permease CcmC n=1 Tax=unclassified Cupriavidus TaxID=2640874 RepID=UPI000E2E45EC|nr:MULTISPECIES: heme ABC transporter permease CcmC [unclassified Cupriavidus]BDB26641.1 cytochrome c biogenesis protein CcsA [Cupriavidus sp. P-10]GLC95414.1 heme export protein [Cupriavidus sp. TA19]
MSQPLPSLHSAEAPHPRSGGRWMAFAAPVRFYPLAGRMVPWFFAAAAVFALAGLWVGFAVAPTDAQQGEVYRIIFIHVPAAWMSMFIYLVMAGYCALALVLRTRLSSMMASALAPTGALFTALALWTGALWGQPTWGTWWVWDARLTSELLLLFLYLGFIALESAIDEPRRAERACAVLALVGVANIPVIYFSVQWWNTLHQGASVSLTAAPSMAATMLAGMLLMTLACWMYTIAVALVRVRCILRERGEAPVNGETS